MHKICCFSDWNPIRGQTLTKIIFWWLLKYLYYMSGNKTEYTDFNFARYTCTCSEQTIFITVNYFLLHAFLTFCISNNSVLWILSPKHCVLSNMAGIVPLQQSTLISQNSLFLQRKEYLYIFMLILIHSDTIHIKRVCTHAMSKIA